MPRIRVDLKVGEGTALPYEKFFQSVLNESRSRVSHSSL